MTQRIGVLVSHPIQYYTPIFRELAKRCDLTVYFAHRQDAQQQADAGYGVAFDWDTDLMSGYESRFLKNVARKPSTQRFAGCNTPDIADRIADAGFSAFVVPGWSLMSYWQAAGACRRFGVPVLVRGDSQLGGRRSPTLRLAKAIAFSYVIGRFDGYLYVGSRNREYLEHYGAPGDRLFFSPHCVDNAAFRAGCELARRRVPRADGDRVRRILFVGRLVEDKRPLDLVRAVARLGAGGKDVELVVAGAGELAAGLQSLAHDLGVRYRCLGFINQGMLPEVYASADLIALPSTHRETWGLVVNEAMACGLPAVVSDAVGCGPDLVGPGTGAVFPLGDIGAFAEAIKAVLDFNPEETRRMVAERMRIYSPVKAAEGIVEAATSLAALRRLR